jgi:translation initiation factor IF-2
MERQSSVRVVRNGQIIHEGKLADMRHVDEVVKIVAQGTECGLKLKDFVKIKEGDVIEAIAMVERKFSMDEARTLYLKKLGQMAKERENNRPG